jgi:hypothetical protein
MCPAWILALTLNRRRNHDERCIFGLMMLGGFLFSVLVCGRLANGSDAKALARSSMHWISSTRHYSIG